MSRPRIVFPVPIARGRLRGCWWLPAGGGKVWRVLGGTYEREQTRLFERVVAPGDAVLDLGAHLGYYTLLASRLVGGAGRVYSFEPDPENAWYLRRHARLNGCRNVAVEESAVGDRPGSIHFQQGRGSGTGRVSDAGALRVRGVRLDDFVEERQIRPAVVKIDVEGAERAVLEGAREVLRSHRPVLFLSTHEPDVHGACERLLASCDYRLHPIRGGQGEALCFPAERTPAALHDPA